jgi:ATP-dependent helicase HrpB
MQDHLPANAEVDRATRERVRKLAQSWRAQLAGNFKRHVVAARPGTKVYSDSENINATAMLVALAYPDRIARLRAGQTGRFQLSNGRGAELPGDDSLAREEFLAIADLDVGERDARVYLAAPLTRAQIEMVVADRIAVIDNVAWDHRTETVVARREQRLGRLIIGETALDSGAYPERTVQAMLEGVRTLGIAALPWDAQTRTWQARVLFLRRLDAGPWPDVSDAQLLAKLDEWLAPFLVGCMRREHLALVNLGGALRAQLTRQQQHQLDELAPTHLRVPSGSRIALDYTQQEESPVLAARVQELFGLSETPRIAGGRAPVTIHLLSPAGRPVQGTRDLASFWARGYQDVKKELKGRYPKHYWPEDPLTAVATRRVRPR